MITAALFDFDGTLVDSDPIHLDTWNRLLAPYGGTIDAHFYAENCSGEGSLKIAEKLKARFVGANFSPDCFAREKDGAYEGWIASHPIPCMPGAGDILEFLSSHQIKLGLVTSAPRSGVEKTLVGNHLIDYFDLVVTRENVARGKPAPDGYLYALDTLHVAGDSAVAFEDTVKGVQASKAAGVYSVAVRNRFTASHDFHAADAICDSLVEAREHLQQLMNEH